VSQSASGSAQLVSFWRAIFWLLFVLNWFIVPLVRFYHTSGYLLPRHKLRESLVFNGVWYAVLLLVGACCFIYLWAKKSLKLSDIEVLVVALSNCWGLILVFLFLAPGLVDIPRSVWRKRAILREQEELEYEVGSLISDQDEVFYELENQVKILHNVGKHDEAKAYSSHIDTIIASVPGEVVQQFPTEIDAYFPKELFEQDVEVVTVNGRSSAKTTFRTRTS